MAGQSHDPWTMDGKKPDASPWKKDRLLHDPPWGIAGPSGRIQGHRPTFGAMLRFVCQKSTTRSSYVMHVSRVAMRGAESWHMGKQPHLMEGFWQILQSLCPIRAMP